MHGTKSLDLKEIYQFDFSVFVAILSVPKLWRSEIVGAINTFETTIVQPYLNKSSIAVLCKKIDLN